MLSLAYWSVIRLNLYLITVTMEESRTINMMSFLILLVGGLEGKELLAAIHFK